MSSVLTLYMQYPPVHVRCTHQSMPIVMTLSPELRVPVPTVGGIHLVIFQETTSIVMEHSLNWLIPTLDKSSIRAVNIISGVLVVMGNCCSYSPQESP